MSPTSAPPRKRQSTRKSPARKAQARKPPARKATPRKTKPRKATARKPPARRPAARKRSTPKRKRRLIGALTWRHKLLAALALVLAAGGGYLFWLRDSSLVAVTDVEVVGVTTSDRPEIVAALSTAAKKMTTLHSDADRLRSIGERFPTVAGLSVDPNFPHGMRIEVSQRPPRLVAEVGGDQVAIAADGTVLTGLSLPEDQRLPTLALNELPSSGGLTGEPLEQATIAGSAPDPLLGLIEKVGYSEEVGVELTMRGGIELRFGAGDRAERKWASAAAVFADPKLDAATYVDVRVPERPVVGGAG